MVDAHADVNAVLTVEAAPEAVDPTVDAALEVVAPKLDAALDDVLDGTLGVAAEGVPKDEDAADGNDNSGGG